MLRLANSPSAPVLLDHEPTRSRPVRVVHRPPLERHERITAHKHPWPQLTFALEGVFRVVTPGLSWIVPPLRAIWIPAMVEHEVTAMSKVVMHAVRVRRSLAGRWREPQVIEVSAFLRAAIIALRAGEHEARAARSNALSTLILDEVRGSTTLQLSVPLPQDKRLRNLCDQLSAAPASDLTLDAWAHRVGASARTLERLFAAELATNFQHWRQTMRIAHALALIGQGRDVAHAAAATGYKSQSAFAAMFKKALGKSPREFFRR
jgi:AraC-like DNA-binding protein